MDARELEQQVALARARVQLLEQYAAAWPERKEALEADDTKDPPIRESRLRQWTLLGEGLLAAQAAAQAALAEAEALMQHPPAEELEDEDLDEPPWQPTQVVDVGPEGEWVTTAPDLRWTVSPEYRDFVLSWQSGQTLRWALDIGPNGELLIYLEEPESQCYAIVRPSWD
ncbi:MAG: hypothetical protein HS116_19885 [Planctomycetes bacterium]|nr:hypothetical protein [Planctomycetota bacterium]